MGKILGATLLGILAGVITVGVVETVGHTIFPPPEGLDVSKPEGLREVMAQIPVGAKVTVLVGWALASIVAGIVAGRVARERALVPAMIAGAFILAGGVYTMVTIPHPVWMMVLGVIVPLPMAWLGSRLMQPRFGA